MEHARRVVGAGVLFKGRGESMGRGVVSAGFDRLAGTVGSVTTFRSGLGLAWFALGLVHERHLADTLFHFLAGLERYNVLGLHGDRFVGSRVACPPGFTAFDLEDPKVPKFDPSFAEQGLDDGVKCPLDDFLGLELSQLSTFSNLFDDFFLGHVSGPRRTVPEGPSDPNEV
jgi:hypothetical protein